MDLFQIVFNQVALMCMMMLAGGISYRFHWLDDHGVSQISNLLLYVINPLTMIAAYQIPFSFDKLQVLLKTFFYGLIVLIFLIAVVQIFFKNLDGVEKFALCFANAGFIGIPLVKAVLSDAMIFHLSAFLVAVNIVLWTYGIYMITNDKSYMTLKKAFLNPGTIGCLLGILLFISPVKLPKLVYNGVSTLANLNTPLAMLILGAYIQKSGVFSLFTKPRLLILSLLRLVALPLLTLLLLAVLPIGDHTIRMVIFIATSAPSAVNTMIFPLQFGGDSEKGARLVSLSSLLCLVTLPVILGLSAYVI